MNGSYTTILLRGIHSAILETSVSRVTIPLSYFLVTDAGTTDVVVYPEIRTDVPHAADFVAATFAAALPQSVVLLADVQEGEKLRLRLWEQGTATDEYIAEPGYDTGEEMPPQGGDAARFCGAFGVSDAVMQSELHDVFRAGRYDEFYGFNNAQDRHRDIAELLGLSPASVGMGFGDLEHGTIPEGVSGANSVRQVAVSGNDDELREYVIFAAPANTSEAQIAARFLSYVIALDDDFLGEELPALGSPESVEQRFLACDWKRDNTGALLRYTDASGNVLVAQRVENNTDCESVTVWSTGSLEVASFVWEALCRETGWGVWDFRTRRVIVAPTA